jgi:hypothetical protein
MTPPRFVLQTVCPNCKRVGANVLVLSTTHLRFAEGAPCVECTGCHAFYALGDLCQAPMDFYTRVQLVNS